MNRFLLVKITVVVSVLAVSGQRLSACGDKFLINGRIAAYAQMMKAAKPGILLVIPRPRIGRGRRVQKGGVLDTLLIIAGHKFRIETDRGGFETALTSGRTHRADRLCDHWAEGTGRGIRAHQTRARPGGLVDR